MLNLKYLFDRFEDEYIQFERIKSTPCNRPDLCAFIRLDKLVPGSEGDDIVLSAEHDEIWLDVDPKKLAEVATEEDILYLIRCGVRYDEDLESLTLFV